MDRKTDRQTDRQTESETYTEDIGENIKLLNSIETCRRSDRPSVWMSQINYTQTHVT